MDKLLMYLMREPSTCTATHLGVLLPKHQTHFKPSYSHCQSLLFFNKKILPPKGPHVKSKKKLSRLSQPVSQQSAFIEKLCLSVDRLLALETSQHWSGLVGNWAS